MSGQYDINLSNGNVLATLYPLEVNGPDNLSTPRQIIQVKPQYPIVQIGATFPFGVIKVSGNVASVFIVGLSFDIVGSTSNDGTYTVANLPVPGSPGSPQPVGAWYDSGQNETNIIVTSLLPSATADGGALINAVVINSDLTYRLANGFTFTIQDSSTVDGTYTVGGPYANSYVVGATTFVPVVEGLDTANTTIPLPLGTLQYSTNDPRTSLKLPGTGVINYGEMIIENMVHMLENFASNTAPELNSNLGLTPNAQPLVGQLWYRTTPGEEGMLVWNGSQWTNSSDVDSGALIFRDIENSNNDIYVTASETNLPSPWSGNGEPGLVIWPQTNPSDDKPVFRVLSQEGSELLRVDYSSNTGYLSSNNNLNVKGTGTSYIDGILETQNIHTTRLSEKFTIIDNAYGVVVHDCTQGHTFVHTDPLADWTADLDNLNLPSGYTTTITMIINQTASSFYPENVIIEGTPQTIMWKDGIPVGSPIGSPITGSPPVGSPIGPVVGIDVVKFTITNYTGTYTVLGELSSYA